MKTGRGVRKRVVEREIKIEKKGDERGKRGKREVGKDR